jgi:hypothetical protein
LLANEGIIDDGNSCVGKYEKLRGEKYILGSFYKLFICAYLVEEFKVLIYKLIQKLKKVYNNCETMKIISLINNQNLIY